MILLQTLLTINYPIWQNVFFYLFIGLAILTMIAALIITKRIAKKITEVKIMQQQHAAKIDLIRKEHSEISEIIRLEMLKREDERIHQWIESEKETLHVLNGVSTLLDLNEKVGRVDSNKIMKKLDEIHEKVENLTDFNEVLAIIKERVEILSVIKENIEKLTKSE